MSKRLLIVGGVAGGASAAARARRIDEHAEIIMFEKGPYVSFANCGLPYYIGDTIKDRSDLIVTAPDMFTDRFNIDVRTLSEVIAIDPAAKKVKVKNHRSGETYEEPYDKLILAPGASPIKPPLLGINLDTIFTLRTIPDTDRIRSFVDEHKLKAAVVVGGGFIGLEMAENLAHQGVKVTIIEMLDQVMAPLDYEMASLVHHHLVQQGIDLRLKEQVASFSKNDEGRTIVTTASGAEFISDMVILSIGVKPDSTLAQEAGLTLNQRGAIVVDDHMRTSNPDIYAVGDAVEVKDFLLDCPTMVPLAGPANKQGRIAAENAMGRDSAFNGVQGTAIAKVFNQTVASTGVNEKTLKRNGIKYQVSFTTSGSHASYYPGATLMNVKLIFTPDTGKLLGAQIVGQEGVDKRIDVLATAIRAGMTVYDLEELELAYAPPYSSAKDPVNMAGFVAANMLRGDLKVMDWNEIECIDTKTHQFLDVREEMEVRHIGMLPGALHIPVNSLRKRLGELEKGKKYIVYCASGLRSYIAHRMLQQHGFDSANLAGGYNLYRSVKDDLGAAIMEKCKAATCEPESVVTLPEVDIVNLKDIKIDHEINACGLQCPGPIVKLKRKVEEMQDGQVALVTATDTGFKADVAAWCRSTGNQLLGIDGQNGEIKALVRKGNAPLMVESTTPGSTKKKTLIVFSNDLDKAMASFIIANGAAAMGNEVTMFFTFWGLNILRRRENVPVKKDFLSTMFGMMMPKGAGKLSLSKLNMGGMGTEMMKYVMKNKNVDSLDMLIKQAQEQGVRFVACTMSMDVMGIKKEELIDGVEEAGVAAYLNNADQANVNLFI